MYDAEKLYALLPAIYRIRDAAAGEPLKALIQVLAEQALAIEENLEQLYDDQFIETCAAWAVPYIGDLIGARGVHAVAERVASPRAVVANTIAYRRRKGTAAVLEQLARDATGWPARAVEFFQLLATTQYMNHIRPGNLAWTGVRDLDALAALPTPFTTTARTVDVRRITRGRGKHNIPNVGIFVWRIQAYPLTDSPAFKLTADPADRRYLFDPLGRSLPLYNTPVTEDEITQLAQPVNVPDPITRRALSTRPGDYYSERGDRSLRLETAAGALSAEDIAVCDLSDKPDGSGDWARDAPAGKQAAVDPQLGRFVLAAAQADPPIVSFHYGFSADLGGGEYARQATFDPDLPGGPPVAPGGSIQAALNALTGDGVIEIPDSGRYAETPVINAQAGQRIELRAADEARPLLLLGGDLVIDGGPESEITLNGLLIAGGAIRVRGDVQRLVLRHCTLAPGAAPSLIVETDAARVTIDHCILGAIRASNGAPVDLADSIVDALSDAGLAYAAPDGTSPGGPLSVVDSTVVGRVRAEALPLVSNAILLARRAGGDTAEAVRAERTQEGCARFSYVPLDARAPRRYRCQPEDAARALRMRPQFTSLRFGDAGYAQLSLAAAVEIRAGADDESEMGAFHDLRQPQRETNLRVRLDEYLRFGLEAGIFHAS